MSKQYYDVEVFWKKSYFVRVYAGNKKEAKEKAKELSPEKNPIKKYFDVLGEEGSTLHLAHALFSTPICVSSGLRSENHMGDLSIHRLYVSLPRKLEL